MLNSLRDGAATTPLTRQVDTLSEGAMGEKEAGKIEKRHGNVVFRRSDMDHANLFDALSGAIAITSGSLRFRSSYDSRTIT